MAIEVKWCGIDYGQCLMDPTGLRNYQVIGDVSKELGQPELVEERIHKYRAMKERYKSYGKLKIGYRSAIFDYVFDGVEGAEEVFNAKEQEYLMVAKGAKEVLQYLKDQGIHLAVVGELKTTLGEMKADVVMQFISNQGLLRYFEELITPQGRVDFGDNSLDEKYVGKSKTEGDLWEVLAEDLKGRGIKTTEAVMVGDKVSTDINQPKQKGFKTIQYIGYVEDKDPSEADFRIADFRELKEIIKGRV